MDASRLCVKVYSLKLYGELSVMKYDETNTDMIRKMIDRKMRIFILKLRSIVQPFKYFEKHKKLKKINKKQRLLETWHRKAVVTKDDVENDYSISIFI